MHADTPPPWQMGHYEWIESVLFWFIALMVTAFLLDTLIKRSRKRHRTPATRCRWQTWPEVRLIMLGLPLELLWEIAQLPLYDVWHQNDWSYILYGLAHCTLGDLLILFIIFELITLLKRDRYWFRHASLSNGLLFTGLGLAYTVYSEINNVRIKGTWGYTESMPLIPLVEIGGAPFMQWLLIPPVLLWLMWLLSVLEKQEPS